MTCRSWCSPAYTALLDLFAVAFLRTDDEHREHIKRLAWFTTEFGLLRVAGRLKVFGAELPSSAGEMRHVMDGRTPILPFSVQHVLARTKAIYTFNEMLFAFDSLAGPDELSFRPTSNPFHRWLAPIPRHGRGPIVLG